LNFERRLSVAKRDVFIILGLLCIVGGASYQFSPGVGAMVAGAILMVFGVLGGEK
jgi:drug/metabolite transporter (DMT)-like permease